MKLADYMARNDLDDEAFAALIHSDRTTVSRLRRAKQRPSWETAETIWAVTSGKVAPNDFAERREAA
jgi:DNA-binding XRE family transcriptional regulator